MQSGTQPKYLESLMSLFQTGTVKQLAFMLGVAVSVALGIVIFLTIQEPVYRPLDYQITQQNMATIIDTLDKANVQYKINEKDGLLYVAAKDFQTARLKLSSTGIPKDDTFNYSFLNEQTNLGNSQFIENARYLRALEADLSKTISSIQGVSAARVHIAVPQSNVFADESGKTTASVVLEISPSFASDREKIGAITQIIADSVTGLDPRDVAITDQYGHLLTTGLAEDIFNVEQLNYQNSVQTYYEKRIMSMVTPLVGENKVSVRVYANIDFTQQEDAVESFDPDKKAIRSEESDSDSSSDSGGASGAPGSLSNSPPSSEGDASKQSSSGGGNSHGHSQNIKNYELTKSVHYAKENFAKVKSLSVAVVVDNEQVLDPKSKQYVAKPVDPDKINKITELVKASIGFSPDRGDKVTVINSGFTPPKQEALMPATHMWELPWFWEIVKRIIGITLGFAFLFLVYRRLSGFIRYTPQPQITSSQKQLADLSAPGDQQPPPQPDQKQNRLFELKNLASTDPDKVASIIKNWVGKQ